MQKIITKNQYNRFDIQILENNVVCFQLKNVMNYFDAERILIEEVKKIHQRQNKISFYELSKKIDEIRTIDEEKLFIQKIEELKAKYMFFLVFKNQITLEDARIEIDDLFTKDLYILLSRSRIHILDILEDLEEKQKMEYLHQLLKNKS
jgi:hypothetical protein